MSYQIEQRDEQLRGTTARITYDLHFDRASQHLVRVVMTVSDVTGATVTAVMPAWTPGSYKVRDYAGYQGNVEAFTVRGGVKTEAPFRWRDKSSMEITTNGADVVEIHYVVYGFERTVRTNHINRNHAFLVPTATMMYVEGRMQEIHHVVLHHDQHAWPTVSTQLSEVVPPSERGVVLGALNYDILADSPLEIGNHLVRTFDVQGARHELAVASSQPVDIDWLAEQIRVIVNTEAAIFGSVPYDRYVFILQCYPNSYGGLEHARSSVNAVDPQALLETSKAKGLLALLCHEYFHLWNVKRIRPVELGPFDYTKENYTPMLWLAEGVTSYYDDLLSYRCGFLTQDEYLNTLSSEHLTRLMLVPGRFRMSTRDSSFLSWVKLYLQSPDGNNRFPSYYLKGGVVTMLLDLYIIDHTDGRTSLDDGLRGLWERYLQDPSRGLTEDECIAILERSTGVQLRDRLMQWLNGTTELPYAELFEPLGLKLLVEAETAPAITFGENRSFASVPAIRFTGLTVAESSGKVLVKGVLDGSPGQRAGIGIDDELVALDGTRVTGTKQMDQILAAAGDREVLVTAQCDGVVYSTTMSTAPVMKARLQKMDTMTSRQQQLFDRWLRRP